MKIERRCVFSASHHLWRPEWDEGTNRRVFGRAASPYSHGHNYTLEVVVEGAPDAESGMLLDLKLLREQITAEVESRFDHRDLNADTPYFGDRLPTAEQFALVIFQLLDAALTPERLGADLRLVAVRLSPQADLTVEVSR